MDDDYAEEIAEFDKNVAWLRKSVAPDDIYEFAEQTLIACDFFIYHLKSFGSLEEQCEESKQLKFWIKNILTIRLLCHRNADVLLDVGLRDITDL